MITTFREHDYICRMDVPGFPTYEKRMLEPSEEKMLLDGEVTVTEKVDGASVGIYKKNKIFLQKRRGIIDNSHEQFSFFNNVWRYKNYEKLELLPNNTVTYGELMRVVHTIKYTRLLDWFLIHDIYDLDRGMYLEFDYVSYIAGMCGLYTVPLLYRGETDKKHLVTLIKEGSAFGDVSEGIVVTNHKRQVKGKIVKPEFTNAVDDSEHWRKKKVEYNIVV